MQEISPALSLFEFWLAMVATFAFAITAVLPIRRGSDIDLFAALVLGLITAVGGGTLRDVILDVPVFWSDTLSYVWVALGASVLAFYSRMLLKHERLYAIMLYIDGFGAALFGIQAAGKAWDLGFALPAGPVILGVVTAIGGGLIRDTLAGRTNLLMKPELYAVPITLGCILFVLLVTYLPDYRLVGSVGCILVIFAVRAAAIHWNLKVPWWARTLHIGKE